MTNYKTHSCPHCKRTINLFQCDAFSFDKDNNLICVSCNQTVFAIVDSEEAKIKKVIVPPVSLYAKKEPIPIILNFPQPSAQVVGEHVDESSLTLADLQEITDRVNESHDDGFHTYA